MELDVLRTLPSSDQRVFLLGRITSETTSLDAALRFVHAALRGRHEIDAFLDAPRFITTIVKECNALLTQLDGIDETGRRAVNATLTAANKLYTSRNRFIHDLLRADLLSEGWELAGLERQPDGEQSITATRFDGMVQLVEDWSVSHGGSEERPSTSSTAPGADSQPEPSKGDGTVVLTMSAKDCWRIHMLAERPTPNRH